jgi:hypothetical protein
MLQQRRDEGSRSRHLLDVVQYEQQPLLAEERRQAVEDGLAAGLTYLQYVGNDRDDQLGIANRGSA